MIRKPKIEYPKCPMCGTPLITKDKGWRTAVVCPVCDDDEALRKRYDRRRLRKLREVHALIDCREDYLEACWNWLYCSQG